MGKSITQQLGFSFAPKGAPHLLIGLVGRRGSGKDTVAQIACDLDSSVVPLAFGGFVKAEVAAIIGHSVTWVEEHKEQLRPLLQAWGTEWRRDLCDPDYWVAKLEARISHCNPGNIVIVTDVRFENETQFIKDRGGLVIRITRGEPGRDPVDYHSSETWGDVAPVDAEFENNADTPEGLRRWVGSMLEWAVTTHQSELSAS